MESLGSYLKAERELRHVSLKEIAQATRIQLASLERLEADRWDELPGEVFVRGFLRAYAQALGLSMDEILRRYNLLYPKDPTPTPSVPPIMMQERGSRWNVTFALVILFILFTLALSMVMRPRPKDAPLELSNRSNPWLLKKELSLLCCAPSTTERATAS